MKIKFFRKIHLLSTQLWVIKIIIKFVLWLYFIILHCLRDLPGRHDKRSKFHNLMFHLLFLKWFTWVFWMFDQSLNVRSEETQRSEFIVMQTFVYKYTIISTNWLTANRIDWFNVLWILLFTKESNIWLKCIQYDTNVNNNKTQALFTKQGYLSFITL